MCGNAFSTLEKENRAPICFDKTTERNDVCRWGFGCGSGPRICNGEWMHIALSVAGTHGGTLSSAGPIVYVNGEKIADGSISQTSSGNYAKLRRWFDSFTDSANYSQNYIGRSQYAADVDFAGSLSDFRIYQAGLTMHEVIEVM